MDLQTDIQEAFEFEWELARILLKHQHCMYPFTEIIFVKRGNNLITASGQVRINITQYEDNRTNLRNDMKFLVASLYTGIQQHHKYHWQKIAHKLGALKEITAEDMCECKYCGDLTPLTMVKMCVPCKRVYDAVSAEPKLAAQILDELTEEENTSL